VAVVPSLDSIKMKRTKLNVGEIYFKVYFTGGIHITDKKQSSSKYGFTDSSPLSA
jgi:hypothetical protein